MLFGIQAGRLGKSRPGPPGRPPVPPPIRAPRSGLRRSGFRQGKTLPRLEFRGSGEDPPGPAWGVDRFNPGGGRPARIAADPFGGFILHFGRFRHGDGFRGGRRGLGRWDERPWRPAPGAIWMRGRASLATTSNSLLSLPLLGSVWVSAVKRHNQGSHNGGSGIWGEFHKLVGQSQRPDQRPHETGWRGLRRAVREGRSEGSPHRVRKCISASGEMGPTVSIRLLRCRNKLPVFLNFINNRQARPLMFAARRPRRFFGGVRVSRESRKASSWSFSGSACTTWPVRSRLLVFAHGKHREGLPGVIERKILARLKKPQFPHPLGGTRLAVRFATQPLGNSSGRWRYRR